MVAARGGLEAVRAGGSDGLALYERKGGSSVLPLQGCSRGAAARTRCLLSVRLRSRAVLRGGFRSGVPGRSALTVWEAASAARHRR